MHFQELFIWLAREHQFWRSMDGPGGSSWLWGALWVPMVAPGGSWRKFMKTTVLLSKTCICHSPAILNDSHELYSESFKIIKTIVLSTSGANGKKSSNRTSWAWFCRFLGPTEARKSSNLVSLDWFSRCPEPRPERY